MWDFENFQNPITDKDCQLASVRIRTILKEIGKEKGNLRDNTALEASNSTKARALHTTMYEFKGEKSKLRLQNWKFGELELVLGLLLLCAYVREEYRVLGIRKIVE
ncbi:hypothetical protein AABB24_006121 [Solanum stoloniferum]|uniref:Uncharacterized protein n=1 Tax=Solanum stoloniferum TaxID=62892 RepID=A0ABD2V0H1_9SOLN